MATSAKVLLIGYVQADLDAQRAVLKHFWTIETALTDGRTVPELQADLVVVCESLPNEERQRLVELVREQAPLMLVVKINGYDSGPHAGADATVSWTRGPGALVSTIYELLTERGLNSRGWQEHVRSGCFG